MTTAVNFFMEYKFEQIEDKLQVVQPNETDTFLPKCLVFDVSNAMTIDEFENNIKYANFKLLLGDDVKWCIPLRFLHNLNKYKIEENQIAVVLPFEWLSQDFNLQILTNQIMFEIENLEFNNIENVFIVNVNKYSDSCNINNYQNVLIQILESKYVDLEKEQRTLSVNLDFTSNTKGYFIEGDIDNLIKINLLLNDCDKWLYDKSMLNCFTYRISNNILYVPFSNKNKNNSTIITQESYVNSCNQSEYSSINLVLTFSSKQNNVGVHCISSDIFYYN